MSEEYHEERARVVREVRQRLESLKRAGVDRVAAPLITVAPRPVMAPPPPPAIERPAPPKPVVQTPAPTPPPPPRPAPEPVRLAPASLFGEAAIESPAVEPADRPAALAAMAVEVAACTRCPALVANRSRTVFGVGSPTARLMFIGEAPGADEDRTGEPFVGRAGVLLTDMITKGMGLRREDVYIANVVKSRPPENRNPMPDEIAHCLPFLERQIAIIRPEFLCLLGKVAASALLDTALPIGRLRGKWHRYRGIAAIVTYHPAYLLRNPASKKEAWEDLQVLMKAMGITPPGRNKGTG